MTWHSLTLVGLGSIPGQGNKIHKPCDVAKKKKKKKSVYLMALQRVSILSSCCVFSYTKVL